MPMPVITMAMPPTTTATTAAAVASPRWAGARVWCARPRAPAADAAGIDRRLLIGDGLYVGTGIGAATLLYSRDSDALPAAAGTEHRPPRPPRGLGDLRVRRHPRRTRRLLRLCGIRGIAPVHRRAGADRRLPDAGRVRLGVRGDRLRPRH